MGLGATARPAPQGACPQAVGGGSVLAGQPPAWALGGSGGAVAASHSGCPELARMPDGSSTGSQLTLPTAAEAPGCRRADEVTETDRNCLLDNSWSPGRWAWRNMFNRSVVSDSATPWAAARQAPLSVGILQAGVLEWVAMSFSRGSSRPRDQTQISRIAGAFFPVSATRETQEYWRG